MSGHSQVYLVASAAALALIPALARGQAETQAPPTPTPTPAEAARSEQASTAVSEVVVTARQVSENLQAVPLTNHAILGEVMRDLGPAPSLNSFNQLAPNVSIWPSVGAAESYATYMRGFGRDNQFTYVEGPIALYVDDVYYPFPVGPTLNIGDISRVEVLEGPQGSLYGRSATIGAFKFYTNRPSLTDEAGTASVSYGSYNDFQALVSQGGPIVQNVLGMSYAIGYHESDGWLNDVRTGKKVGGLDDIAGRVSFVWKPTANLTVFVSADGTDSHDQIVPLTPTVSGGAGIVLPKYGSVYNVITNPGDPLLNKLEFAGVTGQVEYDLGSVTLKYIAAYRSISQAYSQDFALTGVLPWTGSIVSDQMNYWTQELRATGSLFDNHLTYVLGVFYLHSGLDMTVQQPNVHNNTFFTDQDADSTSLYGHLVYDITKRLSLSAGLGYSIDNKAVLQSTSSTPGGVPSFVGTGSAHWSGLTPTVNLSYKLTDDILAYATWARGYEAGSLNSATPSTVGAAGFFTAPITAEDYEGGIKSEWFNHRLRLNIDYYYQVDQNITSGGLNLVTDLPFLVTEGQRSNGIEADFEIKPISAFDFGGNVATDSGRYIDISPNNTTILDLPDLTPKYSPSVTFSLHADYKFDNFLNSGGSLDLGILFNWQDHSWKCLQEGADCYMPAFDWTDVHATYTFPNGRVQFVVAGTNVTNTEWFEQAIGGPAGARVYQMPAVWTGTVRVKF